MRGDRQHHQREEQQELHDVEGLRRASTASQVPVSSDGPIRLHVGEVGGRGEGSQVEYDELEGGLVGDAPSSGPGQGLDRVQSLLLFQPLRERYALPPVVDEHGRLVRVHRGRALR